MVTTRADFWSGTTARARRLKSPLREFLPSVGAISDDFSTESTASRILEVLASSELRTELISAIDSAGATLTWERTAHGYLEVYQRAVEERPRSLDRTLLEAVTLHPMMGIYLSYLANQKEDPNGTRTPDQMTDRHVVFVHAHG